MESIQDRIRRIDGYEDLDNGDLAIALVQQIARELFVSLVIARSLLTGAISLADHAGIIGEMGDLLDNEELSVCIGIPTAAQLRERLVLETVAANDPPAGRNSVTNTLQPPDQGYKAV